MIRIPGIPPRRPPWLPLELGMAPGERVVAFGTATTSAGEVQAAVATVRALYVQAWQQRLPWHLISRARWEEPMLDLSLLDGTGRPAGERRLRLDDPRDLPAAVHDRVTDSVLVSERVDLGQGRGALMAARRDSDSGDIRWSVVFDAGLDPAEPSLRSAADAALADLRSALGI